MRIEQHHVGTEQIGPDQKRLAVRQLDMRHLQLDALAADMGLVLALVEQERLPVGTQAARMFRDRSSAARAAGLPSKSARSLRPAHTSRHRQAGPDQHVSAWQNAGPWATCAALTSQPDNFSANRSSLFGRAGVWNWGSTILARNILDGIANQAGPPCNLANGHLVP